MKIKILRDLVEEMHDMYFHLTVAEPCPGCGAPGSITRVYDDYSMHSVDCVVIKARIALRDIKDE